MIGRIYPKMSFVGLDGVQKDLPLIAEIVADPRKSCLDADLKNPVGRDPEGQIAKSRHPCHEKNHGNSLQGC